jgi:hypothetical protein
MKPVINPSITNLIPELSSSLKNIQPGNSEAVQLITYTLLATAIVGIMVYHYIKKNQQAGSHQSDNFN